MKAWIKSFLLKFVLLFLCLSCSSDLDFDQANDVSLSPVVEVSFFFYNLSVNDIINFSPQLNPAVPFTANDTVALSLFNESFLNENLIRVDIAHDTQNTLDEDVEIEFNYVDPNFQSTIQPLLFDAPANTVNQLVVNTYEGQDLDRLKASTQVIANLDLQPTQSSYSSIGELQIRSKATFYFLIE